MVVRIFSGATSGSLFRLILLRAFAAFTLFRGKLVHGGVPDVCASENMHDLVLRIPLLPVEVQLVSQEYHPVLLVGLTLSFQIAVVLVLCQLSCILVVLVPSKSIVDHLAWREGPGALLVCTTNALITGSVEISRWGTVKCSTSWLAAHSTDWLEVLHIGGSFLVKITQCEWLQLALVGMGILGAQSGVVVSCSLHLLLIHALHQVDLELVEFASWADSAVEVKVHDVLLGALGICSVGHVVVSAEGICLAYSDW